MDWGSKYVGAVVRLAGLLSLADRVREGWGAPVDLATVQRAARLGVYFAEHALAAFDAMGADPLVDDARYILDWIERTRVERFTKRELFSAVARGRFRKAADLDPVLNLLATHGYLQAIPVPELTGVGRPPSPAWLVHPDAWRRPAA